MSAPAACLGGSRGVESRQPREEGEAVVKAIPGRTVAIRDMKKQSLTILSKSLRYQRASYSLLGHAGVAIKRTLPLNMRQL